jgi:hypothetical protein
MGKNRATEEAVEETVTTPAPARTKVMVRPPAGKVYGFAHWAKMRGKQERHLGGLKAYLGAKSGNKYSLEQWDELVKAY